MPLTDLQTLRYDAADGIATITLDRPDKLNAFTTRMRDELIAAFDATDADDAVRAVIVTGAGRAFCAGADLSAGGQTFDYAARGDAARESAKVGEVYRDGGGMVTLRIFNSLKPVIGAINGPAVGIGATMQLPMDIRLASTEARFGFVFARRGIVPVAASSWFLPRVVGISQAMEWVATGRVFGADHPMAAHQLDSQAIYSMGRSADAYEGVQSFLEKRAPRFTMKPSSDMPAFYPWWKERTFRE